MAATVAPPRSGRGSLLGYTTDSSGLVSTGVWRKATTVAKMQQTISSRIPHSR